jgi:hypothetical protein
MKVSCPGELISAGDDTILFLHFLAGVLEKLY